MKDKHVTSFASRTFFVIKKEPLSREYVRGPSCRCWYTHDLANKNVTA